MVGSRLQDVREVFTNVIGFDRSSVKPMAADANCDLNGWLSARPDAWRVDRTISELRDWAGQQIFLLVGEEGCGKTTQLDIEFEQRQQSNGDLLVRLDFTGTTELAGAGDRPAHMASPLGNYLTSQVEKTLMNKPGQKYPGEMLRQYYAARHRVIIGDRAHYTLRDAKLFVAEQGGDIDDIADFILLDERRITDAVHAYETQNREGTVGIEAVQRIPGYRTIFIADNIDHLGEEKASHILETIGGALRGSTLAYIAIRTDLREVAISVLRHYRKLEEIPLANLPISTILTTRLKGAVQYIQSCAPSLADDAKDYYATLVEAVDSIDEDNFSAQLIQNWQNGNVRQTMLFINSIAPDLRGDLAIRSVRGAVFHHLIERSDIAQLKEVFSGRHIRTRHRYPFMYLRLRLLAYLARHDGTVSLNDLKKDFLQHFGIRGRDVDEAIESMSRVAMLNGAFVRRTLSIDDQVAKVMLLPAGKTFIESVVYSCDYLAWLFDQCDVREQHSVPGRDVRQVKLDKAVLVVHFKILKDFRKEHPYVRNNYHVEERDLVRLGSYATLFGYGAGQWFLTTLLDHLESYAITRDLDEELLRELKPKILALTGGLDKLLGHE